MNATETLVELETVIITTVHSNYKPIVLIRKIDQLNGRIVEEGLTENLERINVKVWENY